MKTSDPVAVAEDKSVPAFGEEKYVARTSSSDAEVGHGSTENMETTKRGLKARHAQMIALGGTIGTGLFVGSGG